MVTTSSKPDTTVSLSTAVGMMAAVTVVVIFCAVVGMLACTCWRKRHRHTVKDTSPSHDKPPKVPVDTTECSEVVREYDEISQLAASHPAPGNHEYEEVKLEAVRCTDIKLSGNAAYGVF